jgi:arylsulfatase A-like enzyme
MKPNILFIHVDQMHADMISALGSEHVNTPAIDQLVQEGYTFTKAYCAMPQCCPSRACWYTGRMSKEHGVVVNAYPIDPNIPDLGQWLRKQNYECVYTGKWHVSGRDLHESFDVLQPQHGMGEINDANVARSAVAFLKNRPDDKPFFLNVGFLNPHDCCFPAMAHGGPGKYAFAPNIENDLPPLPGNFDDQYAERGRPNTRHWSRQDWQYYIYQYHRMVEMVDAEVGRVMDALRASPYADNTLVIFASDHGDGVGFHSKVSKGFLDEEAFRVPTIAWWPGHIPEGVLDSDHLISGVDIPATICDYAGAPPLPKTTIAQSMRPIFEQTNDPWRDYVIGETSIGPLSVAVVDQRYKSIIGQDNTRLYDLQNDPLETQNISDDPVHAEIVTRHRAHFREYISQIEMYPEPKTGQEEWKRGNLYRDYINWYTEVLSEI